MPALCTHSRTTVGALLRVGLHGDELAIREFDVLRRTCGPAPAIRTTRVLVGALLFRVWVGRATISLQAAGPTCARLSRFCVEKEANIPLANGRMPDPLDKNPGYAGGVDMRRVLTFHGPIFP